MGTADSPTVIGGRTYMTGCKVVVCRYKAPGNYADDFLFVKNGELLTAIVDCTRCVPS
jgi:hypothetical protein